jgi:hypothetical protein
MDKIGKAGLALLAGAILLTGCGVPDDDELETAAPPGAIPAAPDVRPGTESAPGGVAPAGGVGNAGDRAMPSDTVPGAATGVDTVGMQRP